MLSPLGGDLSFAIQQLGISQGLAQYRLVAIWEEVVGQHLALQSEPISLKDNLLMIKTSSAMWSQELMFRQREILRRVAELLGGDHVKKMRCRVGKVGKRSWLSQRFRDELDWQSVVLTPAAVARVERIVEGLDDENLQESARRALLQWEKRRAWERSQGMRPCELCGSMQEARLCFSCERENERERLSKLMRLIGRQPWMTMRELQGQMSEVTQAEYYQARRRLRSIYERNYWNARDTLPVGVPFPPGLRQLMIDLCMLTTGVEIENLLDRHILKTYGKIWGRAFLANQVPDLSDLPRPRVKKKVEDSEPEVRPVRPRGPQPGPPRPKSALGRRRDGKRASDPPTEYRQDS